MILVVALFSRCKDDEVTTDTYVVAIEILHPDESAVLPLNQAADIHVKFIRANNGTIHNLQLEILDNADNVVETLHHEHSHQAGEVEVLEAYTPTVAGAYKIKAESTDDDGLNPNTKISTFTAQ